LKKWLLLIGVLSVLIVVSLSGCSSGVPADYEQVKSSLAAVQADLSATKADLTAANNEIAATKAMVTGLTPQVTGLSAMSAYSIWYDQYYEIYNYQFADTATFQKELGALIAASGNAAAKTAWDTYLATNSIEDFGEIGAALYDAAQYAASQYSTLLLQYQMANISLITAYDIWYDQYVLYGTDNQMYSFTDGVAFNTRLGDLITAANNSDVQAAWDAYIVADTALADVLAELPEDYNTWTAAQTDRWSAASTARTNALGNVGTALFNAISG
jgi:hypothetical protein